MARSMCPLSRATLPATKEEKLLPQALPTSLVRRPVPALLSWPRVTKAPNGALDRLASGGRKIYAPSGRDWSSGAKDR